MKIDKLKEEFYSKFTVRYGGAYVSLVGHPIELWEWIEDKLKQKKED